MTRVSPKKNLLLVSLALGSTLIGSGALAQDGSFKDVPNGHWAYAAIEKLTRLNPPIFIGDSAGMFAGTRNLPRNETAAIIARLLENIDATYAKKREVSIGTLPYTSHETYQVEGKYIAPYSGRLDIRDPFLKIRLGLSGTTSLLGK